MTESFTIDRMQALPRLSGLRCSPDGRRLVVAVGRIAPDGKKMTTALWQVDPAGERPARRLTRSVAGEAAGAAFLADGSLLFGSVRPDPDAKAENEKQPKAALWLLPPDGGDARLLLAPDGGVDGIAAAAKAPVVAFGAAMHPGAASLDEDAEKETARHEAGVEALLFEDYPIRHWDHWLGPRHRHLLVARLPGDPEARLVAPRDLQADAAGFTFEETEFDVSPDGSIVVGVRRRAAIVPETYDDLVAWEVATGSARELTHGDAWYASPAVAPDGRSVAAIRCTFGRRDAAEVVTLVLVDLATGEQRTLAGEIDRRPEHPVWGPDASALYFSADDRGHRAAYRVDLPAGTVTRLTRDAAVTDLCPSPDGATVYALASTITTPPRIVRFDARTPEQVPVELPRSVDEGGIAPASTVERVEARAADGTTIGAWLVRPAGAPAGTPAPLVVLVHGGPISSWHGWHWRWNPHILADHGFAILLPDPAISTGYGQAMIQRGWGAWGDAPYADVMSAVDAALERPGIDRERVALMGGSFGGYMANWVAGKTDRFRCIVTHASLWELLNFHGTTDHGPAWEHEMGDPYEDPDAYLSQSPRMNLNRIRTPMLVIHGERDHRVPISEALILWTDMHRMGIPGRFLLFPDENHWVLKPQNARIWYATVLAFLDEHLLGKPFVAPALL